MTEPLVTVVVPTYNGERYVAEAVRSALAQDVDELEVLVVDDGSKDATVAVLDAIQDPRIRIVPGPHAGAAANWNRGVDLGRGRYILVLCQDDRLLPGCLRRQLDALGAHPGAVLAAVGRRVVDRSGRVLLPRLRAVGSDRRVSRDDVLRRCLARATNVVGEPSAVLFERSAWEDAGRFRASGYVIDLDMWLRLLEVGDGVLLADCLADFRVHDGSWSAALRSSQGEATSAFLSAAAVESGLPLTRTFGPRLNGRRLGRGMVFSVSKLARPTRAPTAV